MSLEGSFVFQLLGASRIGVFYAVCSSLLDIGCVLDELTTFDGNWTSAVPMVSFFVISKEFRLTGVI